MKTNIVDDRGEKVEFVLDYDISLGACKKYLFGLIDTEGKKKAMEMWKSHTCMMKVCASKAVLESFGEIRAKWLSQIRRALDENIVGPNTPPELAGGVGVGSQISTLFKFARLTMLLFD